MHHDLRRISLLAAIALFCARIAASAELEWIRISDDKRGFVSAKSNTRFVPWGFNYDHDETGRLIEDYWDDEWDKVAEDFREMRDLGANVVRIHLQTGKFLKGPDEHVPAAVAKLLKLVKLAEETGLYLDLTGLGCYHKQDVPAWYDELDEKGRWNAQAKFWEVIAMECSKSSAVFCYDLMNEPVVPGGDRSAKDWLGPPFGGKHFVQFITLRQHNRPRPEIAEQWTNFLTAAIRKYDDRHLVTVGLVDWSLDKPGLTSGFVPDKVTGKLDFLAVHIYPEKGKLDGALRTLEGFAIGKPVVIEETFILRTPLIEFEQFIDKSRHHAAGWIGFYWGKTLAESRASRTLVDSLMVQWLEYFGRQGRVLAR